MKQQKTKFIHKPNAIKEITSKNAFKRSRNPKRDRESLNSNAAESRENNTLFNADTRKNYVACKIQNSRKKIRISEEGVDLSKHGNTRKSKNPTHEKKNRKLLMESSSKSKVTKHPLSVSQNGFPY